MSTTSVLNRLLTEPNKRERDILAYEFRDEPADEALSAAPAEATITHLQTRVVGVSRNTNQRLIVVTQDKTILCLKRNLSRLGKRDWIAPLSTVMTLLISLITSNFKQALGLGPAEWRAIFIVSAFIATGWLAQALWKATHAKRFDEVIRDIVHELGARKVKSAQ